MADYDPFLPSRKPKQKTYGKSTKTYDSNRLGRKLWVDLKDDASKKPAKEESEDNDDEDVEAFLQVAKERAVQKKNKLVEENRTGGEQTEDVEGLVGELSRLDIGPLSPLSEHEDKNEFNLPSTVKLQNHRKSLSKKDLTRDDEEKENIDPVESLLTELALEDSATEAGQLASSKHGSHGSKWRSYSDRRTSADSMHDKGSNSTEQPVQRKSRSSIATARQDEILEQRQSRLRTMRRESNGYKASDEAPDETSETAAAISSKRFTFAVEIPVRKISPASETTTSTASRSKSKSKRPEGRFMGVDSNDAASMLDKSHRVAPIPASPIVPPTPNRKGGLRKKKDRASSKSLSITASEASAGCFLPEKTSNDSLDIVASTRQPSQPSRLSSRTAHIEEKYEEESEEDYFNSQLEELLEICTEHEIVDFTQYIKGLTRRSRIKKLGEASYSEVFLQSSIPNKTNVLKIIPFGGNDQCLISQIIQEVRITQTMAQFPGFIDFEGAVVTQGRYPQQLLKEWYKFDEERGSENYCPDFYGNEQLFIVILLEDGGQDLEHFDLKNWSEAREIFKQTAKALAIGEQEVEFEHRDLHYGNVVIKRKQPAKPNPRHTKFTDGEPVESLLEGLSVKEKEPELEVSLIDYTLSRASITDKAGNGPTYFQLEDPELFSGKGIYQFDIYRFMRRHLYSETHIDSPEEEDWSIYLPKTNVFWLHYVLHILLNEKNLNRPLGSSRRAASNPGMSEEDQKAYRDLEQIYKMIDPRRRRYVGRGGDECRDISCAEELVWWAENEKLI